MQLKYWDYEGVVQVQIPALLTSQDYGEAKTVMKKTFMLDCFYEIMDGINLQ